MTLVANLVIGKASHTLLISWYPHQTFLTVEPGVPSWVETTEGQWRGALMFLLIFAWINGCANNREAGDLRRHRVHYDVAVMWQAIEYLSRLWLCYDLHIRVTHFLILSSLCSTRNSFRSTWFYVIDIVVLICVMWCIEYMKFAFCGIPSPNNMWMAAIIVN